MFTCSIFGGQSAFKMFNSLDSELQLFLERRVPLLLVMVLVKLTILVNKVHFRGVRGGT